MGKKPYSYIAFSTADTETAEPLAELLEQEGYRFWFNSKVRPNEEDIAEIGKRLGSSAVTILVMSENAMRDPIIAAAIESTIERRMPLVVYMTHETEDTVAYLHTLFERSGKLVTLRAWEQSFLSSNSVRQTLEITKGLTYSQVEKLYEIGTRILSGDESTKEQVDTAMQGLSCAAANEYPPAMKLLGDIALGRARSMGGSYSTAVAYYKAASEKGDVGSVYQLGCLIADGEGFAKNPAQALQFIAVAAVNNIADAQFRLAEMMEYGNGVAQNRRDATKWYLRALENGDRRSYLMLADRYLNGDTVTRDEQTAAEYYKEAANDGSAEAELMLAKMYRDGVGVRADAERSNEYFLKAAEKGIAEAQYNYGLHLYNEKKYVEAFKWLMLSVDGSEEVESAEPNALYLIGHCYENGYGTSKDRTKAFMNYYIASKLGHTKARESVANCYKHGYGVPMNKRAAAFFDPKGMVGAE